jgi:hypothetical protein
MGREVSFVKGILGCGSGTIPGTLLKKRDDE